LASNTVSTRELQLAPRLRNLILALMIVVAAGFALNFILTYELQRWDFRNNLWLPTHLLASGQSPYSVNQLDQATNAVWLPTAIGAYLPFGWLPEAQASNLWVLLTVAAYIALVALATGQTRPAPLWFTVALVAAAIFPAFVSLMRLGQFGVFAALFMLVAARCITPPRIVIAGLLVALATAKPQLILLPAFGLWCTYYFQYGRASAIKFSLSIAAWALLLLLPLWLGYPDWLADYQPTAFVLLPLTFDGVGYVMWLLLAGAALAANVYLWKKLPPHQAMPWSLALNVLVMPYGWSWDFILLIPLLVQMLFTLHGWLPRLLLLAGYVGILYLMIQVRLSTDNSDWLFWWLPWLFMALIVSLTGIFARKPDDHTALTLVQNE
jgi:hypothetical protein